MFFFSVELLTEKIITLLGETTVPEGMSRLEKNLKGSLTFVSRLEVYEPLFPEKISGKK